MKSDLTCPVEIISVQVEQKEGEQQGQIVCLIDFFNLSAKVVDSLQMNIICFDAQGERLGGRLVRSAVMAQPREKFSGAFAPEHVDGAVRVEAAVEKVWYQDGILWRREERNVREYTPNALPQGRELDRLKVVAGEDAAGYAREDDIVWMCVCGRANRTSEDICVRCERAKEQVLRDYSFAAIDGTLGQKERERQKKTEQNLKRSSEETMRVMKAQQKQSSKRKKRMKTIIALLCTLALVLAGLRWGVPYAACLYAQDRLDKGLAADAKEIFLFVDGIWTGYMNAGEKADEAERKIISGLIIAGTDVALDEAAQRAKALDDAALYEQAVLARAALAHKNGDTDLAEELYASLENSEEAHRLLLALIYELAQAAADRVDYPTAIERFASLGDYEDAPEKEEECIYLYGRQLMREGKYEQACDQFMQVLSIPDAMSLLRSCRYSLAGEKMDAGEYIEAAVLYESLGVYEEAETRAKKCRYTAGMALLSDGLLEDAAEQLKMAQEYEDAPERFEDAAFTLGNAALEEKDYQTAILWLEQIDQRSDAKDALAKAVYAYAGELEAAGKKEEAVFEYARLGDYEDAADHMHALEYDIALEEMKVSPEEAYARFEGLGSYKDSKDKAKECLYAMAIAASDAGDHDVALERFEALGSFGDSKSRARSSRYAYAGQLLSEGEYAKAAQQYAQCGAYLDAEEMTMRARYMEADAMETAGKHQNAAAAFAALGSYEDAKLRTTRNETAWLGETFNGAKLDLGIGDYDSVIAALEPYVELKLPERYASIPEMYETACLEGAKELIERDRPLDALPLLERIADNKQAKKLMENYVYRVIGRWKDAQGTEYIFRKDGTCSIAQEEGYFGGKGYAIFVADTPYPTKESYSVVSLRGKNLTLKNAQTGKNIRLTYVGEATPKSETAEISEE